MVFELQGTVHELKESVAALTRTVERGFDRVDGVERTSSEIKELLRLILPKLESFAAFAEHRAPFLADRTDITKLEGALKTEIDKRPTRRQSIQDIVLIITTATALVVLGSHFAK